MSIVMEGSLADLGSWRPDQCSLAKALEVIGTRSTLLILREACYGTTRFSAFVERIGITDRAVAEHLRRLTKAGLLTKRPYREGDSRTRYEYVLTDMGRDLLPVVIGLMQWGDKHLQDGHPLLLHVEHSTGTPVRVELRGDGPAKLDLEQVGVRRNT
ncbi:winged helix-turn-helix transcriptional regulator [Nocardia sp. NPDC052566]|uniref:winged helix-turn-helix transcriptional regulator n=1 Tax=Nocardia sp. NPDC052566 TaxID=3364330 RepID=UPI0037CB1550